MPGNRGRRRSGQWLKMVITLSIMIILMAATLAGFYLYMQYLIEGQKREGFSQEDLIAPADLSRPIINEQRPVFITSGSTPSFSCKLYWPVNSTTKLLDGYAGIGAVLNITIENTGISSIYIEKVEIATGWGFSNSGSVGKYLEPGEERYMRHLHMDIPDTPPDPEDRDYTVSIDLLIDNGLSWVRKQNMVFDPSTINILIPPEDEVPPSIELNNAYYFDKITGLIREDREEIDSLVENSSFGQGAYSIQKIADIFEFVTGSIEYISDPATGGNQWISPMTCLARGGGDCEDYSILFASLIDAVGGNARVIITSGHAFNAVYIGEDLSVLSSLEERYGTEIPFQIYEDDLGKWLIIEPQSYLVFGWFPLDVGPVSSSSQELYLYGDSELNWDFTDSEEIYIVDIYFK